VTVVSDKVLFSPGSADLQPIGRQVLGVVADVVREVPNDLMVEGHTDNTPINTAQFPSNWELSTERATHVLRELVERNGIPAERVSAAGYGEHHPVASNTSADGRARNRRVELVILSQVPVVPQ
jgi:chemotaxis protein MotB